MKYRHRESIAAMFTCLLSLFPSVLALNQTAHSARMALLVQTLKRAFGDVKDHVLILLFNKESLKSERHQTMGRVT